MGSESSAMERPDGWGGNHSDDRSRSPSPLPRYEDPRNNSQYDTQGMEGLPLFPSTMPERRISHGELEKPQLPQGPASEPHDMDAEQRRAQKKKKKKKHRSLGVADEPELPRLDGHDRTDNSVADSEEERHRREDSTPRKKKKKRLSGPSWQPADEGDPSRIAALALSLMPRTSPTEESPRKKKRRTGKNNEESDAITTLAPIAEDDALPLDGVGEIIPSSIRSPGKRRSSESHKSPKRRRLASPFEPVESEPKEFDAPARSFIEYHLNGNSQPIAELYDRSRQQPSDTDFDNGVKGESKDPREDSRAAAQDSIETASDVSSHALLEVARDDPTTPGEGEDTPRSGHLQQRQSDVDMGSVTRSRHDIDEIESVGSNEEVRNTNRDVSIESGSDGGCDPHAPQVSEDASERLGRLEEPEDEEMPDAQEPSTSTGSVDMSNAEETSSRQLSFTGTQGEGVDETGGARGDLLAREIAKKRLTRHPQPPESAEQNQASEADDIVGDSATEATAAAHKAQRTPTKRRPLPTGRPKAASKPRETPAQKKKRKEKPTSDDAGEPSSAPRPSGKTPGSSKQKRRIPKPAYFDRQEEEVAKAFAELPGDEAANTQGAKKSRKKAEGKATKKKGKKAKLGDEDATEGVDEEEAPLEGQYRKGALTGLEQQQVRDAVEKFRENNGFTQEEVNQIIHENPQKQKDPMYRQIWTDVLDSCPTRPRQKLINWCRQNFHNFVARGTWTKEQDDELEELINQHGKKWAVIGGLINRHQNDVRDRYRNYIVCRDKVKLDYWSREEEEQLYDAVQEAVDRIREDKTLKDSSDETLISLINWQLVAETMGFSRSRLQCMKKWRLLGESRAIPETLSAVLPSSSGWRLEAARKDLKKITPQEKYKLVRAISNSKAHRESGIPWREIVQDVFGGEYERKALMVMWARLRQSVPDWKTTAVKRCAKYLVERYEEDREFGEDADGSIDDGEVPLLSQRSTPAESVRSSTPHSSQSSAKKISKGYRKPRPSVASRPVGEPVGRLSQQAMARNFRSKKVKSAEFVQETSEDEIEESPQEEDINALPKESSPEPSEVSEHDDPPTPKPTSGSRLRREQSVDLSLDSPAVPSEGEAPPSAQPRTYSSKIRNRDGESSAKKSKAGKKKGNDNETDLPEEAVDEEAVQTPRRKKRAKASETVAEEEQEPSKTPRSARRARAIEASHEDEDTVFRTPGRRERAEAAESAPADEEPVAKTPRSAKRARLAQVYRVGEDAVQVPRRKKKSQPAEPAAAEEEEPARTPRSAKKARHGNSSHEADEAADQTPKQTKKSKGVAANGSDGPSSNTRSGTVAEPTWGWNAINTNSPRPKAGGGEVRSADMRSVVSSDMEDMEDMEDIPARLPRSDDEEETE